MPRRWMQFIPHGRRVVAQEEGDIQIQQVMMGERVSSGSVEHLVCDNTYLVSNDHSMGWLGRGPVW